jgi:hypothetical protein
VGIQRDGATRSSRWGLPSSSWVRAEKPGSSAAARPVVSRERRRRATCASARSFHLEAGIGRSCGCARGLWWLQKSTSGAWSRPKGPGSSPLAHTFRRASAEGETAPEAGSRWRKPRAREQRHRWRAPRDPTRTARKRGTRPGEGALGDGRRPGSPEAAVFDETAAEAGLAIRSDGDAVSRPDPQRVVTGDVRGDVASSARGRKHRDREVQRGGAVDRGSARTALCRSRGVRGTAPATRSRAALRGSREDCGEGRSRRFAVKRSSTWSAHLAGGRQAP